MKRQSLIRKLRSPSYRRAYVASRIKTDLAFQIRLLRERKGWTQADLAKQLGVSQPRVAQMEDPSYGKFSTQSLRKLAAVFDVALIQKFAPFSELVDWSSRLSQRALCPQSFDDDKGLAATTDPEIKSGVVGLQLEGTTMFPSVGREWASSIEQPYTVLGLLNGEIEIRSRYETNPGLAKTA